ncbi:uncharacterized protein G2W53_032706 [Senna tora]|uniref:Uncharacterized protein n=1 Tax=Senna tora TaxID=362788 RepID=A0A834W6J2_9FABA|nr:uncharacterized protein G2W53_032706 [Senna tora]
MLNLQQKAQEHQDQLQQLLTARTLVEFPEEKLCL